MEAREVHHLLPSQPPPPPPPPPSPAHQALLRAGPRLHLLRQAHAHVVVSGSHRSLSLLTKLINLACAAGAIGYARQVFSTVPWPDSFLFNSLIKSCSKFGFPHDAVVFYRCLLLADIPPSNYTFTSVIKACADLSALRLGRGVHAHALACGFGLDPYVQSALVAFYAKSGELNVAREVFDKMRERTVVAWNSIISGYEQNGSPKEAIELFDLMRESGIEPDSATFVGVLAACAQLGALSLGSWVHEYVMESGFDLNAALGTSLINMYARCGNVSKSREVFDLMREINVIAWTAMISAYAMNGYGNQAVELFDQMRLRGPWPNRVTFVAVLSACAHAGLVDMGRHVFASMKQEYDVEPGLEHYVCMVDMLGRAGFLDEAYRFVEEKIPMEAPPAVWTAMLGACKMHKNFDLGVRVAEHLLDSEPDNPGHYVMLSNIYALAGRSDRVQRVRNMMIQRGLKKQVGYSNIEVDGKTYMFSMGDKSHPETNIIYEYLDELMLRCTQAGYIPLADSLMHELEGEEREYALRFHSEKLAVSFGLLKTSNSMTITIVKNLRMCEDCHLAFKYVSVIANREIVVRDKLRFHHFKDGSCSCLDFW
ncbi:pentatricopeptide repeat-containing protein At2g33760 [Rhodamnia argentea]|uniref:Pentatricopeptide repeat-containing protein At2g33760 n=1 Tax=Rhodamnia argentea TaxID=178133 RepID=A0A8B8QAV5_9MYRT|nr:pentatricopeptide repeat-containing protein At2g33760 [Rhodamnia argentea]